jgi:uncharacterized membrane protein YtjA (UPF0391 family)
VFSSIFADLFLSAAGFPLMSPWLANILFCVFLHICGLFLSAAGFLLMSPWLANILFCVFLHICGFISLCRGLFFDKSLVGEYPFLCLPLYLRVYIYLSAAGFPLMSPWLANILFCVFLHICRFISLCCRLSFDESLVGEYPFCVYLYICGFISLCCRLSFDESGVSKYPV